MLLATMPMGMPQPGGYNQMLAAHLPAAHTEEREIKATNGVELLPIQASLLQHERWLLTFTKGSRSSEMTLPLL